MVQRIEGIRPELQIHSPIRNEWKGLGETEILVKKAWATKIVTASDIESDRSTKGGLGLGWIGKQVDLATRGFMDMGLDGNAVAVEDRRSVV